MKASLVLGALFLRTLRAQESADAAVAEAQSDPFATATPGGIVDILVDNGRTLPPGASFEDPTPAAPLPTDVDTASPPEEDVVSPPGKAKSPSGVRFGAPVPPVTRILPGIVSGIPRPSRGPAVGKAKGRAGALSVDDQNDWLAENPNQDDDWLAQNPNQNDDFLPEHPNQDDDFLPENPDDDWLAEDPQTSPTPQPGPGGADPEDDWLFNPDEDAVAPPSDRIPKGKRGRTYPYSGNPPYIGPSGWDNEDDTLYDGEDRAVGKSKGKSTSGAKSKGRGKSPSSTKGNGRHYDSDDDWCPPWCRPHGEDASSSVESTVADESEPTASKKKWRKKKKATKEARQLKGFSWPAKDSDESTPESDSSSDFLPSDSLDAGTKGRGKKGGPTGDYPNPNGNPFPYEETTPYPYDSQYDQNTDYADNGADQLPDWLIELQNPKGKTKHKGKCPKRCTRPPPTSSSSIVISVEPSSTEIPVESSSTEISVEPSSTTDIWVEPSTTEEPPPPPTSTTLVTVTTWYDPPTSASPSSSPTGGGDGGGSCPNQCNPFNPAENFCDSQTTGCTTAGADKYYCACRAGYKLSNPAANTQFKVPGQPYVYTGPGAVCDQLCGDSLCSEVQVLPQCL